MFRAMTGVLLLGAAALCFAVDTSSSASPAPVQTTIPAKTDILPAPAAPAALALKFSAWAWFTMGRIISSPYEGTNNFDFNFEKEWLIDYDAGIKLVASMPHNWTSRFHLGMTTAYPVLDPKKRDAEFLRRKLAFYMIDAAMEKTIKVGNHTFYLECGFLPVKYNPQAMNMGEYLYRSGTYPQYLISGFELADKEKLTGIHFQYKNNFSTQGWFKGDFYLTSGMRDFPIHDISPSLLLAISPHPFVEVGAGAEYSHLIAIDRKKTYPYNDSNMFPRGTTYMNFVRWVDTAAGHRGDTVQYTFAGIKSEVRLTLNPQSFFPEFHKNAGKMFLGKEDLKIYGEFAVLGWKNYPGWYNNRLERMPVMAGFNCPTFQPVAYTAIPAILAYSLTLGQPNSFRMQRAAAYGVGGAVFGVGCMLLDHFLNVDTKADVIALEGEYYSYKYINSAEMVWRNRAPVPYTSAENPLSDYYSRGTTWFERTDDDRKWSVYFSKKLFNCLRISGLVASDHIQRMNFLAPPPGNVKYTEIVPRTKDWYWMTRIMYYF